MTRYQLPGECFKMYANNPGGTTMRSKFVIALGCAAAMLLSACGSESELAIAQRTGAPLLQGLGEYHREISSTDEYAQRYSIRAW